MSKRQSFHFLNRKNGGFVRYPKPFLFEGWKGRLLLDSESGTTAVGRWQKGNAHGSTTVSGTVGLQPRSHGSASFNTLHSTRRRRRRALLLLLLLHPLLPTMSIPPRSRRRRHRRSISRRRPPCTSWKVTVTMMFCPLSWSSSLLLSLFSLPSIITLA